MNSEIKVRIPITKNSEKKSLNSDFNLRIPRKKIENPEIKVRILKEKNSEKKSENPEFKGRILIFKNI